MGNSKKWSTTISEILGLLIMIIPFIISIKFNRPGSRFLFKQLKAPLDIQPDLVSSMFAVAFYAGMIARYGIFKRDTIVDVIITAIRTFMNIWVLSSLVVLAIGHAVTGNIFEELTSPIFVLFIGIMFTWLGMKSIAGFGWIFFIIAAYNRLATLNQEMKMLGAVYIICIGVSMILQVKDLYSITNFMQDFSAKTNRYGQHVRNDIHASIDDVSEKLSYVSEIAGTYIPTNKIPKTGNRRKKIENKQ